MRRSLGTILMLPMQAACALALLVLRCACSHPRGSALAAGVVGGFGEPIWIRRCGRCGAEVRL